MLDETIEISDYDSIILDAANTIIDGRVGSASLLQRKLMLGNNRANRLLNQLEELGVVGEDRDSRPRELLVFNKIQSEEDLVNKNFVGLNTLIQVAKFIYQNENDIVSEEILTEHFKLSKEVLDNILNALAKKRLIWEDELEEDGIINREQVFSQNSSLGEYFPVAQIEIDNFLKEKESDLKLRPIHYGLDIDFNYDFVLEKDKINSNILCYYLLKSAHNNTELDGELVVQLADEMSEGEFIIGYTKNEEHLFIHNEWILENKSHPNKKLVKGFVGRLIALSELNEPLQKFVDKKLWKVMYNDVFRSEMAKPVSASEWQIADSRNFKELLKHGTGTSQLFYTVFPLNEIERVNKAIEIWNKKIVNDDSWVEDELHGKIIIEALLDEYIKKRDKIIESKKQEYIAEQTAKSSIYNWQCPKCGTVVRQNEQPRCQKCNDFFQQM